MDMRRDAYVATRRQLPFGGDVNVGMVARRDHSTVAALLLAVPEALRGVACARKVQLTAYRATLVTADRLRIGDLMGVQTSGSGATAQRRRGWARRRRWEAWRWRGGV